MARADTHFAELVGGPSDGMLCPVPPPDELRKFNGDFPPPLILIHDDKEPEDRACRYWRTERTTTNGLLVYLFGEGRGLPADCTCGRRADL
jgi:hypothetical protein